MPKYDKFNVRAGDGVKVIFGKVCWKDKSGTSQERTKATQPYAQISTIVDSETGSICEDAEGAGFVLMRKSNSANQPPYSRMDQLKTRNIFPGERQTHEFSLGEGTKQVMGARGIRRPRILQHRRIPRPACLRLPR